MIEMKTGMGRATVNGKGQGLDGDLTTTGAVCISSLPEARQGGRAVLRLGDGTTPCKRCGKAGVIVDSLPSMTWHGIATVLDGAQVHCGCAPGSNRLIAPAMEGARSGGSVFSDHAPATGGSPWQAEAPHRVPVPSVNDRAATRKAIIGLLRSCGHEFVERSSWGAVEGKSDMPSDWNYSMVALHHAGRSYSCGDSARQMVEIQKDQQRKNFEDFSYHYAIDCRGSVYEGRDIRLKGESVLRYNTGVVGIVLLDNFTTAEEGGDGVALWRESLEQWGVNTASTIPEVQVVAVIDLLVALMSVFNIKRFGGHREFPNQAAEGKICPGNIGMDLVRRIREKCPLLAPPLT